jgi:hypothetical protein
MGEITGYGLDGRSLIPGRGNIFLSPIGFTPALEPTHPFTQCKTGVISPGVKRQGREADYSPRVVQR